jgi:hypothetical protein
MHMLDSKGHRRSSIGTGSYDGVLPTGIAPVTIARSASNSEHLCPQIRCANFGVKFTLAALSAMVKSLNLAS